MTINHHDVLQTCMNKNKNLKENDEQSLKSFKSGKGRRYIQLSQ